MNEITLSGFVAMGGLICTGLVALYYRIRMRRFRSTFDGEDIALLKIAKDNLTRIWKKHNPRKNVVQFEEWRVQV